MEKSKKHVLENKILNKKSFFLEAVNQLKKTSDCIKIDPPGPGQNLEKVKKSRKIVQNFGTQKSRKNKSKIWTIFKIFLLFLDFFAIRFFISKKQVFSAGAPLRGALGRAPPPFGRVEILKKFIGKSVPESYTLFFRKN